MEEREILMNSKYQYRPNFNYFRDSANYYRQISDNNGLFSSTEGFMMGNMFKNIYVPYKAYRPANLSATNEQSDLFLRLSEAGICGT